jgi:hypothetical protein
MEHPRTAEDKVEPRGRPEISQRAPADDSNGRQPCYRPVNQWTVSRLLHKFQQERSVCDCAGNIPLPSFTRHALGTLEEPLVPTGFPRPLLAFVVLQYLTWIYPNNWIRRKALGEWPTKSPDLISIDFVLWVHLRAIVYVCRPRNIHELTNKIVSKFANINAAVLQRIKSLVQGNDSKFYL